MVLLSTDPMFSTTVPLVMSLQLLLLLLQGTGWLLLQMADLPIGRTAKNRTLPSVAARKLMRQLKRLSGCCISHSWIYFGKPSSMLPWVLWGCAITGSIPVEWILWRIELLILFIIFVSTFGEKKQKCSLRQRHPSVPAVLTAWLMLLVSHICCAPPAVPHSSGTLNSQVFKADRQSYMEVASCAITIRLILSLNDLSYVPICRLP